MEQTVTRPSQPWTAEAVLSALGTGRTSIDRVADRLGARDRRAVLGVKRALVRLAAEGRAESCGGGIWVRPGDAAGDEDRAAATGEDLLRHGFAGRSGALSLATIARNVERATGRDGRALANLVPPMIDAGLLRLERRRCYAPTDAALAKVPPAPGADERRTPASRALDALATPIDRTALAAALGVSRERARQVAMGLVADGLAARVQIRRADGVAVALYHAVGAPGPATARDAVLAAMPDVPVGARTLAAATDRHVSDVTAALRALARSGLASALPTHPVGTWLRLGGEPGPRLPDPQASGQRLPQVAAAGYAAFLEGRVDAEGLRARMGPAGHACPARRLEQGMAALAAAGHCRAVKGGWAPTALGRRVAEALAGAQAVSASAGA